MNLTVDGLIYQRQRKGGISRIFNETLPRMCNEFDSLSIHILALGKLVQSFPRHDRIQTRRLFSFDDYLWPQRIWWPVTPLQRELALLQMPGKSRRGIWHSTYYSLPPAWDGPTVVSVYDLIHEKFSHLFQGSRWDQARHVMKRAIQRADLLLCISDTTAADLVEVHGVPSDRIRVAPLAHASIFEDEGEPCSSEQDKPFLLTVGSRFGHPTFAYKNVKILFEAYVGWKLRREFGIVCVADSWSAQEKRVLSEMGLSGDVRLLTNPTDTELAALYRNAAAFVYPSTYEGFGIPVLEALASKCPVVTTRVPSMLEVGLEAPFYFDPHDVDELRLALSQATAEGKTPARIAEGRSVSGRYSWEHTARATLEAYRSVL
jgi:glycosyltransferase involved in cell wall biosynthesis